MTGRRRPSPTAGVQTLSARQSSLSARRPAPATARSAAARRTPGSVWGALGPNSRASRTPVHFTGLTGGMKRLVPAVLAPYGTPLKILMPSTSTPRILPNAVSATTKAPSAARALLKETPVAATRKHACLMKSRRVGVVSMKNSFGRECSRQMVLQFGATPAGGWWLVTGGWWLVVGGWWLVVGGW